MDITSLFPIIILIFSIVIHEVAHGVMANWLGDPTAKYAGRLTLNPISHIDPIGSILLPLLLWLGHSPWLFGWAKPVPYNPYNLNDQKYGSAKVGLAGPASNLIIAIIFGIIVRILINQGQDVSSPFLVLLGVIIFLNVLLAIFNLFPIPPLDGSKILFDVLPYSMQWLKNTLEKNWLLFFILFFLFGFKLIYPLIVYIFLFITGNIELFINVVNFLG